ncbi:MAG: S9 family peptidase [Phycisphaerales bacterium]|nr:S9 family peptidase [Phycisphaerales bacterium]NNM26592.1 S9 family peptidase [Phycisphaerales bacterium]
MMIKLTPAFAWLVALSIGLTSSAGPPVTTPRDTVIDTMHGVEVPDPYRWMESESSTLTAWVNAQDGFFRSFVDGVPIRDAIVDRIAEIGEFDSVSPPTRAGNRWFSWHTPADRARGMLMVREGAADAPARVLVDPEAFFPLDTMRLTGMTPSPDGTHVVIACDDGAGTWGELRLLDVDSGRERPERLTGISGPTGFPGVRWLGDGTAFVYWHFDVRDARGTRTVALRNPKLRLHVPGTPQSEDPVLAADTGDPTRLIRTFDITNDDRFLVYSVIDKGTRHTTLHALAFDDADAGPITLARDEATFGYIGSRGSRLMYRTDAGAPNFRVIGIDLDDPAPERWIDVIPEGENQIAAVWQTADRLIVNEQRDVKPVLRVHDLDGRFLREAQLPGIGGVGVTASRRHSDVYYRFGVLFDPMTIYTLDTETGASTLYHRPALAFDPEAFVVEQVFYESFDGTRVPMFIARRRDLQPDGTHPLWMYGYGHGGWSAFPWFQPHLVAWLEMGGFYALPGIRGGGEYGAAWRDAGMARQKPNAIGDYLAAGEWLIENGYASRDGLVANGGSASGFLPVVATNRRPDLFGAAVVDWPFLDMLRYHHFASGFTRSFGSPDDPVDFAVLHAYSPYHNIEEGTCYPPTLVAVGERDLTTPPLHGYKYIAALQHAQACERPAMIQMIRDAGHYSYGTTPEQRRGSFADQIAFLIRALELPFRPPVSGNAGAR